MVLIFDDNEFRRKETLKAFRNVELPVKADSYDHCEYHIKPLITVLVMPKPSEIDYYLRNMKNQGTVFVIVLKREALQAKYEKHVIIDSEARVNPSKIIEIIKEEYGYNLYQDIISKILVDEEDNDIYFGGKRLRLTKTEYKIARFLAYHKKKMFTDDDIIEYLHLRITPSSLDKYASYINHKCREKYRKSLILRSSFGYGINDSTDIVTTAFD